MKNKKTLLLSVLLTLSTLAFGGDKILMCGSGWKSIALLDKDANSLDWSYDIENAGELNSICLTKDGNIAVTNKKNLMVLDKKTKSVLWTFDGTGKEEVHSVSLLDNGNLLVGICGLPARIVELDNSGKIVKNINFDSGSAAIHPQFRQISVAGNGNYIVPLYSGKAFLEVNEKGDVVNKVDMPMPLFSAMKLKNGNLLLSGEGPRANKKQAQAAPVSNARIVEYSLKDKKIVRTIDGDSVEGLSVLFACQIKELDNGNLLITNYNGHSKDKTQPKLFEIDKNNKLVWKIDPSIKANNITGTYIVK
ncbi:MAG: hypothetical protein R3Y46_00515 [Opitutales bacterium]